jgi:LytR cell envelope-related transcriptional attenuator/Helix-turn-helix domain
MQAVLELQSTARATESLLALARVHRKLTVEEAAARAGISPDAVRWLEDGRVYRFPSADTALEAMLLYSSGLGIGHAEALALAGRPVPPRPLRGNPWPRLAVLFAIAGGVAALAAGIVLAQGHPAAAPARADGPTLAAPWTIRVVVLNGSGDITYTRQVASRIGALGYQVAHVGRAGRFDYEQTAVYFPPGGETIALRLAKTLGVATSPLPGGTDSKRLVVIVGPRSVTG